MSAQLVLAAAVLAAISGVPGLFGDRRGAAGERLAAIAMLLAAAAALTGGFLALRGHGAVLDAAWPVPGGRLRLGVDPIAAGFVVPIAVVGALGAVYGLGYWPQREHPERGASLRAFYGAMMGGLLLLVIARNGILFLVGWELMAVAAFVAITTDDQSAEVREVGYVYLLATRLGTLSLFAMFALIAASTGSLDFDGWSAALAGPHRDAIFVTAVIGFGLKAGAMPLHVWLPGAHASAPSHVSAVMSGVMIKVGIYGLVRVTAACAAPPVWWGVAMIALGAVSAVLGVGFALGQHDLKRLLAYHSVENIGIILLGLGVALLGRALGRADLVALGLAGAVLHVWNHALFKSLLFLAAGAVVHATGTRDLDHLGGLWRRMPRTGLAFLIGAVAICGLPPLNGLISELLVFLGLFRTAAGGDSGVWLTAMLAAGALATVGALALACFAKVFGIVFLGEPRRADTAAAHDPGPAMLVPMAALAGACLFIGLGAPAVAPLLDEVVTAWSGGPAPAVGDLAPLGHVALVGAGAIAVVAALAALLARRTRGPAEVGTWDCGYAAPSPRMQYTASSFAGSLVRMLGWALRPDRHAPELRDRFPAASRFDSHVPDTVLDRGVRPVFGLIERTARRLRSLQTGSVHLYLLYIVVTLIVLLLVWR